MTPVMSKEEILNNISKEKDKYNSYLQLCVYFKVKPDPLATCKHLSKIETLEMILDPKNQLSTG